MRTLQKLMAIGVFGAIIIPASLAPAADTFRPVVRGRRGAVAAGTPLSAEAGMRLLQQGGNAVDAGCAAILAASVIEFSHFSFGGEVPIIIKTTNGKPAVINGQGIAPKLATREFFLEWARQNKDAKGLVYRGSPEYVSISEGGARPGVIPSSGILPATVPGVLDAVTTALDQFGTKTLAEVMQPAIELADGFPIDEMRVSYIERTRQIFEPWATNAKLFLPVGRVPKVGQAFAQPDLARTLREIVKAEKGASSQGRHAALMAARDYFYKGPIARRSSEFAEANGGLLRAADFAAFHGRVEEPTATTYPDHTNYTTAFWAQAPPTLETL